MADTCEALGGGAVTLFQGPNGTIGVQVDPGPGGAHCIAYVHLAPEEARIVCTALASRCGLDVRLRRDVAR